MEIIRALRPFKVQVRVGEFLHFKTGDRIPANLLTGPYKDYILGHCEYANTKISVPIVEPERTIEPNSRLTATPPPLKEPWKPAAEPPPKAPAAPHGGAAMAKQASGGAGKPVHTPATAGKAHPPGKAKPHA